MIAEEIDLTEFLESRNRNQWLEWSYGKVYLRKSTRIIARTRVAAIDLATVEYEEKYRGKGLFTKFVDLLEDRSRMLGFTAIYAENVHNDRLRGFFLKRGYQPHEMHEICYYKVL